ncbi:MAG: rRNA maturation RNase YbeY [Ferruginibacter sp.]
MVVHFFFNNVAIRLEQRKRLKAFISELFGKERKEFLSLNYVFCSDKYLLNINEEFLGHKDYTDIITFSLAATSKPIQGEIYISVDRIKANAASLGIKIQTELHRVMFHGALHLCGYRDKTPQEKGIMTQLEDRYLKLYFT